MLANALAQIVPQLALAVDITPGRQHDESPERESELRIPLRPQTVLHVAVEYPQQLTLQCRGEVTDLVEKHDSTRRERDGVVGPRFAHERSMRLVSHRVQAPGHCLLEDPDPRGDIARDFFSDPEELSIGESVDQPGQREVTIPPEGNSFPDVPDGTFCVLVALWVDH